jgi:hypothetical protein
MPGFYQTQGFRQPTAPPPDPTGSALNSLADALSRVDQQVEGRAQKRWQMDLQNRQLADEEDRTATAQQLQRDQFDASRLATRRAEAAKGVYDTLTPEQDSATVESYDPTTGEDKGATRRYQDLGGGLGYQDVTADNNSDYTRGETRHIASARRAQAIAEGTAAGLSADEAGARYDSDPASIAKALEGEDADRRKGDLQTQHDKSTHDTDVEVARIRAAAERSAAGNGANSDVTRRLAVLNSQIDDSRSDYTVASKLDPDTGEPTDPRRAHELQQRTDSLEGVRDGLAAQQGHGVGQPPPPAAGTPRHYQGKNGGQQAFNAQIPGLIQKRAQAVQKLLGQGMTRDDAERKASDLYNQAIMQLATQYGIVQGQQP